MMMELVQCWREGRCEEQGGGTGERRGGDGESANWQEEQVTASFSWAISFQRASDLWGLGCLESRILINKQGDRGLCTVPWVVFTRMFSGELAQSLWSAFSSVFCR